MDEQRRAMMGWRGALLIAMAVVAGCGEPSELQEMPQPVERSRVIVESQIQEIDGVMVEAARKQSLRQAVSDAVEAETARAFADRVEDGLRYSTVFQREYSDGAMEPVFVDEKGLTPRGEKVVDMLHQADRHAIEVETLHREEIEQLQSVLTESDVAMPVDEGFSPTASEVEALVVLVSEAIDKEGKGNGTTVIVDAVSQVDEDEAPEALQRFREYNRQEAESFAKRARLMAALELKVADGLLRYARVMRHKNMERVDWREMRDRGGSTEVILQRMQGTLGDVVEAPLEELEEVLRGLEPSHEQYRKLLAATDRYREFVDAGGWSRVQAFTVEEGATSAAVEALRVRLEAEGIEARPPVDAEPEDDARDETVEQAEDSEGEADEIFDPRVVDDTLIAAIKQYQRTHQFTPDGDPTPGFWRSINISAQDRLEQMELTLQRWRESAIEDDRDFIMVNIPEFYAEVWVDGQREMRFSVVVGNNRRTCDPDEERWDYPDKTPTMMSTMDHVMLNPPWYVPERIVEQTLMPRVEDNEDYFEEEGYELVEMADGREVVRQLPGEDNALGRAKFIFPNEHNVYLHDTPQQQFFDYGIRAFSHGCIRVTKPLELAEFLLDWMGRDDVDIDEVLESERTRRFDFEEQLPVFLEYYTVWVDDDGHPNFLADVYHNDAKRRADEPEEFMECTPTIAASEEEEPELDEGEDEEEEPEDLDEDLGP